MVNEPKKGRKTSIVRLTTTPSARINCSCLASTRTERKGIKSLTNICPSLMNRAPMKADSERETLERSKKLHKLSQKSKLWPFVCGTDSNRLSRRIISFSHEPKEPKFFKWIAEKSRGSQARVPHKDGKIARKHSAPELIMMWIQSRVAITLTTIKFALNLIE